MFLGRVIRLSVKSVNFSRFCGLTNLSTMSDRLSLFQAIGLSEQKAKETIKNEGLSQKLESIVLQVREA